MTEKKLLFETKHIRADSKAYALFNSTLTTSECVRMNKIAEQIKETLRQLIFDATVELVEEINCPTVLQFASLLQFCANYVNQKHKRKERKSFALKLRSHQNDSESFTNLIAYFANICDKVSYENSKTRYLRRFKDNYSATYHYEKHKIINGEEVTIEKYFELAQNVFELGKLVEIDAENKTFEYVYPSKRPEHELFGVLKIYDGDDTTYLATFYERKKKV